MRWSKAARKRFGRKMAKARAMKRKEKKLVEKARLDLVASSSPTFTTATNTTTDGFVYLPRKGWCYCAHCGKKFTPEDTRSWRFCPYCGQKIGA